MRRFLVSILGGAAAALVLCAPSPARASGDGELYAVAVGLAIFDVVSLPADIYMGVKGEKVPREYAMAEGILGGVQALGGAIGFGVCGADRSCKDGAAFPLLIGFTAWTTAMGLHGLIAYSFDHGASSPSPSSSPPRIKVASPLSARGPSAVSLDAPKASPFALVPMIGDGRTTPVGIGFTGSF